MNREYEAQFHPVAPTLTLSPTLLGLAREVKKRLANERDPMRTPTIVYPNGLIAKTFPWITLSDRADNTSEPCFSGVTPSFSAELMSALLESLGISPLPDSSELIWGSLATAGAEAQLAEVLHTDDTAPVSAGGWARARQLAELLFRLPLYEPATLMTSERAGSSGSAESGIPSGEATLSFAKLWAALSSQRDVPLLDARELSPERLRARAQARRDALADRFVALHLIAPRGLSPLFTQLLDAVSVAIPVHIYLISPPPHALERDLGVTDLSALTLNLQQVSAISQLSPVHWVSVESDLTENTPSLTPHLRRYQAHLLGEENREEHEPAVEEQISVELHRCANDARQVEALRERLEVILRQDKSLTERDVLILVSDLSRFLPHLEAEFPISSQAPKGKLAITLIDRGLEEEHPYQVLFQELLSLPQRRVDLNLIFSLFSLSPVQQRFMVSPARIKVLKRSLTEAGLRWGFDGKDRARVSDLSSPLHSWRFAIERLLISELLDPLDPSTLCLELCAPKAALGEADYQALSVFLDFLTKLEALLDRHPGGRVGRGGGRWDMWASWMSEAIDQLTKVNWEEKESQLRAATIRKAISSIQGSIEAAGAEAETLSLDSGTVAAALSEALKSYRSFRGRVGRGITVAPLPIGAAYPARVVILLGVEEGAFSSGGSRLSFDPLREGESAPTPSASIWARFVESVLPAERLLCFWRGLPRYRHEEGAPPCAQILDLIEVSGLSEAEFIDQPVSPYSAACFDELPLIKAPLSRSARCRVGAEYLTIAPTPLVDRETLLSGPFAPRRTAGKVMDASQLAQGITKPQELFLRESGYQLPATDGNRPAALPVQLGSLDRFQLKTEIVNGLFQLWAPLRTEELERTGADPDRPSEILKRAGPLEQQAHQLYERLYRAARGEGRLAADAVGRAIFETAWYEAQRSFWSLARLRERYHPIGERRTVERPISLETGAGKIRERFKLYQPLRADDPPAIIDFTMSDTSTSLKHFVEPWLRGLIAKEEIEGDPQLYFASKSSPTFHRLSPAYQEKDGLSIYALKRASERAPSPRYKSLEKLFDAQLGVYAGEASLLRGSQELHDKIYQKYKLKGISREDLPTIRLLIDSDSQGWGGKAWEADKVKAAQHRSRYLFGVDASCYDAAGGLDEDFIQHHNALIQIRRAFSETIQVTPKESA